MWLISLRSELPFGNDPYMINSPPPRRVICKLLLKTFHTQRIQLGKFGIIYLSNFWFHTKKMHVKIFHLRQNA